MKDPFVPDNFDDAQTNLRGSLFFYANMALPFLPRNFKITIKLGMPTKYCYIRQ